MTSSTFLHVTSGGGIPVPLQEIVSVSDSMTMTSLSSTRVICGGTDDDDDDCKYYYYYYYYYYYFYYYYIHYDIYLEYLQK